MDCEFYLCNASLKKGGFPKCSHFNSLNFVGGSNGWRIGIKNVKLKERTLGADFS